jgi:hypothetical protein
LKDPYLASPWARRGSRAEPIFVSSTCPKCFIHCLIFAHGCQRYKRNSRKRGLQHSSLDK